VEEVEGGREGEEEEWPRGSALNKKTERGDATQHIQYGS
jgi:hypothetical protein